MCLELKLCSVQSVQNGVCSVECEGRSVGFKVWSVKKAIGSVSDVCFRKKF